MDRLEAMAMLVEVVKHGSFSAAGRALRVPLPTLSRKIADLEDTLGARLLIRTTRKLVLTDAGTLYLDAVRGILELVRTAEREVSGEYVEPVGELIVTAPTMFGRLHVLPLIAEFLERHPRISVTLKLADTNLSLVDDRVDLAVRIGDLADSALVATRIGSMRTVLCGSPGLFERYGAPTDLDDVARFPAVVVDTPAALATWRFAQGAGPRSGALPIDRRLAVTTFEAAADAAVRGAGLVQLLQYQVDAPIQSGLLHVILPDLEPEPSPVHLMHAARPPLPLKIRRFLDFAAPRLRDALAGM